MLFFFNILHSSFYPLLISGHFLVRRIDLDAIGLQQLDVFFPRFHTFKPCAGYFASNAYLQQVKGPCQSLQNDLAMLDTAIAEINHTILSGVHSTIRPQPKQSVWYGCVDIVVVGGICDNFYFRLIVLFFFSLYPSTIVHVARDLVLIYHFVVFEWHFYQFSTVIHNPAKFC